MGSFIAFNEKFQKIKPDELIKDAVLMTGGDAIQLNQDQLYEKSEDSKGRKLREYQDGDYAREKQTLNPFLALGQPDFKLTGDFYNDFYAEVNTKTLKISSDNFKTDDLIRRDGEDIFGLNKDNLIIYGNNYVRPKILTEISLATGLKIIGSKTTNRTPF